jgi:prepilin-type N-terminal cleavage/methylation domain-containing protein
MLARPRIGPRGFTLVELLVVIAIIALISAIALPTILPALNERRVSESARVLQAILAGTRDAAIRNNAPRGIRLLPDPVFNGQLLNGQYNPLASNRIIPIEPGPDYTDGLVIYSSTFPQNTQGYLALQESPYTLTSTGSYIPNNPTSWSFNIRQGDKIRFNDAGPYYTIAGPVNGYPYGPATGGPANTERVIACFQNNKPVPPIWAQGNGWVGEYLFLTNGIDDNGNGWIDESCDGIDNDGDGITDPGFNGLDDNGDGQIDEPTELQLGINLGNGLGIYSGTEFEQEVFLGAQAAQAPSNTAYTIIRRPVVSPGARETTLPAGIVIDLTTYNISAAINPALYQANPALPVLLPERSRVPVDAFTGYVDIMIDQTGRVITPGAGMDGGGTYGNSPLSNTPFYHFWLTEREGVVPPLFQYKMVGNVTTNIPNPNPSFGLAGTSTNYVLPLPQGTTNPPTNSVIYTPPPGVLTPYLTGERRLVTLFVKTGQITSNSIMNFNVYDTNAPFYDAQAGTKEPQ